MDTYYKLKLFAAQKDGEDVENTFEYPPHFESPEDALAAAKYWMTRKLFEWCRCDKYTDPIFIPTGEFKAGIFFMRNCGAVKWGPRK